MSEVVRSWLPKAAMLWVDMDRGLYEWGTRKAPRNGDGSYRVVRAQVLKDCGITVHYRDARPPIWANPAFLALREKERALCDHGIAEVVEQIERVSGPLLELREKMHEEVAAVFRRAPDAEDLQALSPRDYVAQALAWSRYLDELVGRTKSQEQQGIAAVIGALTRNNQVTSDMVDQALELVKEHRLLQDRRLEHAGVIDGMLDDDRKARRRPSPIHSRGYSGPRSGYPAHSTPPDRGRRPRLTNLAHASPTCRRS